MQDWTDIELARQHREELLREARERRLASAVGGPGEGWVSLARRLLRALRTRTGHRGRAAAEGGDRIPTSGGSTQEPLVPGTVEEDTVIPGPMDLPEAPLCKVVGHDGGR